MKGLALAGVTKRSHQGHVLGTLSITDTQQVPPHPTPVPYAGPRTPAQASTHPAPLTFKYCHFPGWF